jgi:hypothetical protein
MSSLVRTNTAAAVCQLVLALRCGGHLDLHQLFEAAQPFGLLSVDPSNAEDEQGYGEANLPSSTQNALE